MATLEGRLFIHKILIEEFGRAVEDSEVLARDRDKLRDVRRRANMVVAKMHAFNKKFEESPEMQDQILEMENIIKKLDLMQNS